MCVGPITLYSIFSRWGLDLMRYRCTTVPRGGWGSAGCENPSTGLWNVALDRTLALPYCGLRGPHYVPLSLSIPTSALYVIASSSHSSPYFSCLSRSFLLGLCVLCALCSGSSASRPSCFCSIQILWVLAEGSPPSECPSLTPAL